jgi:acetyl-CoA C-acetyltransferase
VASNSDGATAYDGLPVELLGWGISIGDLPWYQEDATIFPADVVAFNDAYEMSGITPAQIGYLHTHDCSHISSITNAESPATCPRARPSSSPSMVSCDTTAADR